MKELLITLLNSFFLNCKYCKYSFESKLGELTCNKYKFKEEEIEKDNKKIVIVNVLIERGSEIYDKISEITLYLNSKEFITKIDVC